MPLDIERINEIEKNVESVGTNENLTGLALHYYSDCGFLIKHIKELIGGVKMLENDIKHLEDELEEKRKVIHLNGEYDADQLHAILDDKEGWYDR